MARSVTLADLERLQQVIGISFKDSSILEQALIHPSFVLEDQPSSAAFGQRLEFLGDAFLGYVIAHELYRHYPHLPEGQLTKMRSALVQRDALAQWAQRVGIGEYLVLGRGEETAGGRHRPRNLARAFEALLGAILVDQGARTARAFVKRTVGTEIAAAPAKLPQDHKSRLQELVQSQGLPTPSYRIVEVTGPAHRHQFTTEVMVGERVLGRGNGMSKQTAEKEAARVALEALLKTV